MIANPNDGNSPRVEVATPMIDVSAGGLITATTEQEKGYVPGGTKTATQQLPTQAAKTVTPTTTNQTAVASGRYTTGDVVVSGDANLVPENIAEGVSIFGVTGTHSGGGGGVQTVTGTFACGIKGGATFSYTDGDGVYQEVSRVIGPISVSVVKNSLVLVDASFSLGMFPTSGATLQALDYTDRFTVYRIDQDGFSLGEFR